MKRLSGRYRIVIITLTAGILLGFFFSAYYSSILFQNQPRSVEIQPVQSVISQFNPDLQPMLETIPIHTRSNVESSMALTMLNVPSNKVQILVSPLFSTFSQVFQDELLTHEYLNIIGAKLVNLKQFNEDLLAWYNNTAYGSPTVDSNYFKYTLWYNLYSHNGRDETALNQQIDQFAFIGDILNYSPYLDSELPINIQAYYKGIWNSN
jgi:hypothetical protein